MGKQIRETILLNQSCGTLSNWSKTNRKLSESVSSDRMWPISAPKKWLLLYLDISQNGTSFAIHKPNVTHFRSEKMAVTLPGYLSEWISLRSLVSGWVSNNRMLCCNRFRSPKDAAVTCKFTRMYWNCKIKMLLLLVNLSESSHFHYFWSFFVFFVHILEHLKLFDFFWLFWKLWIYK